VATLLSVNLAHPRDDRGRTVRLTGIDKRPVIGPVRLDVPGDGGSGVGGDLIGDGSVHGGGDQAVYAYAREDLATWATELGRAVEPGAMGENLTTLGVDVTGAVIGERWRIGSAELEVVQPRIPCFKLGLRMGDPTFPKRFGHAARPGAYLRVVVEGVVTAGDPIAVVHRPDHGITLGFAAHAFHNDRSLGARVVEAPELAPGIRAYWRRVLG
jgi:MOSC domain-containing protein YiiM